MAHFQKKYISKTIFQCQNTSATRQGESLGVDMFEELEATELVQKYKYFGRRQKYSYK